MTAVEFLLSKTSKHCFNKQEIEQAKEIEKEQIMNANTAGVNQGLYGYKNSEEYYNKTFKKK